MTAVQARLTGGMGRGEHHLGACLVWGAGAQARRGGCPWRGWHYMRNRVLARTEGYLCRGQPHTGHQSLRGARGCPHNEARPVRVRRPSSIRGFSESISLVGSVGVQADWEGHSCMGAAWHHRWRPRRWGGCLCGWERGFRSWQHRLGGLKPSGMKRVRRKLFYWSLNHIMSWQC